MLLAAFATALSQIGYRLGDVAKLPNQVMVGEAGAGMKNGDSLV
jgi:hypothetical protein